MPRSGRKPETRQSNKFHRLVEDAITEREEMRDWILRAQKVAIFFTVTESDWLQYGHVPPHVWLVDKSIDEYDPYDDDLLDDIYELDDHDPQCTWCDRSEFLCECADEIYLEDDWYDDFYGNAPPSNMEFGGLSYPREDVEDAKRLLGGGDTR